MCLIVQNGKALVADAETFRGKNNDGSTAVPGKFYRLLGGSLEFDESAEEGVRREIREETQSELKNLQLLTVIESRFTYARTRGHEIVFLYKGDLVDESLIEKERIHVPEGTYDFYATWVPVNSLLLKENPLYPEFNYEPYLT